MRKEMYSVKCPEHILIGNPWYWKTMSRENLGYKILKLTQTFDAAVSIEERGIDKILICVVMCFAPKEHMSVYLDGRQYTTQKLNVKQIGMDNRRVYDQRRRAVIHCTRVGMDIGKLHGSVSGDSEKETAGCRDYHACYATCHEF